MGIDELANHAPELRAGRVGEPGDGQVDATGLLEVEPQLVELGCREAPVPALDGDLLAPQGPGRAGAAADVVAPMGALAPLLYVGRVQVLGDELLVLDPRLQCVPLSQLQDLLLAGPQRLAHPVPERPDRDRVRHRSEPRPVGVT